MNNKYYITFGIYRYIITNNDMWKACRIVMGKYFEAGYVDNLPRQFVVSNRGFDLHEDDIAIPTEDVLKDSLSKQEQESFEWIEREKRRLKIDG